MTIFTFDKTKSKLFWESQLKCFRFWKNSLVYLFIFNLMSLQVDQPLPVTVLILQPLTLSMYGRYLDVQPFAVATYKYFTKKDPVSSTKVSENFKNFLYFCLCLSKSHQSSPFITMIVFTG